MDVEGFRQLVILCYIACSIASLATVRRRVYKVGELTGRCGGCQYDLCGLSDDAACPECGSLERGRVTRKRFEVGGEQLKNWWLLPVFFMATLLLAKPAALFGLVLAYQRDGISVERALGFIPLRELGPGGPGVFKLMDPLLLVTVGVLPFLVLLPRRGAILAMAVVWIVGLVVSVAHVAMHW